jgi:hypothetical protein
MVIKPNEQRGSIAPSIYRGAHTFQTMRSCQSHASLSALPISNAPKYWDNPRAVVGVEIRLYLTGVYVKRFKLSAQSLPKRSHHNNSGITIPSLLSESFNTRSI